MTMWTPGRVWLIARHLGGRYAGVLEAQAKLAGVQAFPCDRERRQPPFRRAREDAVVCAGVAGGAAHRRRAVAVAAPPHQKVMRPPLVALAGEIGRRVAEPAYLRSALTPMAFKCFFAVFDMLSTTWRTMDMFCGAWSLRTLNDLR